jgi:hypothetical protein
MSYRSVDSFRAGPGWNWFYSVAGGYTHQQQNKFVKLSVSSWFYYKEICYDARSHERKKKLTELLTTALSLESLRYKSRLASGDTNSQKGYSS